MIFLLACIEAWVCYSRVAEKQISVPISFEILHTYQLHISHLMHVTSFSHEFVFHTHKHEHFVIANSLVGFSTRWFQYGDHPALILLHLLLATSPYVFLPFELRSLLTDIFCIIPDSPIRFSYIAVSANLNCCTMTDMSAVSFRPSAARKFMDKTIIQFHSISASLQF